ncbi:3,4-dihydroxy-2-butanone 4-phosphate synthase [Cladophialophora psammophila CBS 110553]|uniref:3,4-dihydroxy-2-butanone 4-phosphate synthase n=1 Tax=Cladophialophora psammophila CBS 110553 TaxID=1182543 RepID=W9X6P0_9EURO|nr:3,4-dihydroxy-2-butanone 4-phosphate synthase [Cladophialophora psammophila CBS 110553]EXJ72995.1 3,4-dihydroxy-2-butanone 4-phosphate synthase [Cladophialophora psammophila CBS 110553]
MQPPSNMSKGFDTIESTIEAFRNGEFIVVLDSQDRENEGDLIIAAEDVTAEKMAFMIRHTSGLICAPITSQLAAGLALPQMVVDNEDPNRTAYTISIDSNDESVSTGISAHDRALTCRTLASKKATAESFRRPGHVFPLRARDGGVLERTGHTEAAVEFCRLAGKAKVGVICEMVEDGEPVPGQTAMREPGMMRRDACLEFGRKWGLKVCTIEDLVDYVQKEKMTRNGHGHGHVTNGVNGHH